MSKRQRVDLGIVREAGRLEVDVEALGSMRADRQAGVEAFEEVGLRIGVGGHRGQGALGDRLKAGIVAAVDEVEGHAGIGGLEFRLHDVGPEVEDVLVRRGVPVDDARGGEGQRGSRSAAPAAPAAIMKSRRFIGSLPVGYFVETISLAPTLLSDYRPSEERQAESRSARFPAVSKLNPMTVA